MNTAIEHIRENPRRLIKYTIYFIFMEALFGGVCFMSDDPLGGIVFYHLMWAGALVLGWLFWMGLKLWDWIDGGEPRHKRVKDYIKGHAQTYVGCEYCAQEECGCGAEIMIRLEKK